MAQTELHKYTVAEKLNKMDVDLIDVTLTTVAAAIGNNEVISQSIEIPNAVAVNGGSAIIQSVMLLDEDDEAPSIELLFSQVDTAIADAASEAIGNSVGDLDSTFRSFLGAITVSNWSDLVDAQIGVKDNIGLVIKAASGSQSIYVHAINRSGGNYTPAATTDLKLRIGIVKD
jgi:hypothetical protein|tara:strand:+ start:32 stop:550 length:519 start_codon:yes stop_codon:yes gene_type:complete